MTMLFKYLGVAVAVPFVFVGCTSTKPDAAFRDVDRTVAERSGQHLLWMRDEAAAADIERSVAARLQTDLTAQSAVAVALLNNRQLQAAFEDIGVSQAELAQASRLHNPTLAASWRFPLQGPASVNSDYGLAGDFLNLLTLPARKRIAAGNLELTKQRLAQEVLSLAEAVQMAFYTLVAQTQFGGRLAIIVEVNEAAADIAQRQFKAGNINSLELKSQQLAYTQSRLDHAKVVAEARAQREKLNRLLGLWGEQTAWKAAEDLPELPAQEPALEGLESFAVRNRLDLAVARGESVAVAKALNLKRSTRYLPGVNLGVNAEQDLDHSWVVGPTLDLEIPLFDQGQPELARLTSAYRRSLRRFEALAVNVRSEVREARDALIAARDVATYQEKFLLPQNQQLLAETLLQYNAMQLGNHDLLLAKQREQQAEQAAIEALRDYWIARARLESALGGSFGSVESMPHAHHDPVHGANRESSQTTSNHPTHQ
jgi:cobalt-zinc-cadmium efflux system outer membrane protein